MNIHRILATALLVSVTAANASTVVFSDDFDANILGLNLVPTGWTVTDGTVDIIGDPSFFNFIPGSGRFIDLDGSTSNAGVLSTSLALTGGLQHTATFDLAGNHRNQATETVTVNFGGASASYSLPMMTGWTTFSLAFTPASSGSYVLSFENSGGDNVGMLLDKVSVTAVPEPQTYAMMLGGLVSLSALARRRRSASA